MRVPAVLALGVLMAASGAGGDRLVIEPVSEVQKARILAVESPEQKALREELKSAGWMVFNHNGYGQQDIFRMNADGSGITRLTTDPSDDTYPHPSPDGKLVAFSSNRALTAEQVRALPCDPRFPIRDARRRRWPARFIWLMNADGTDQRPVAMGDWPHWFPDGKRLAVTVDLRPREECAAIVHLEKKTETVLKGPGVQSAGMPCATPDGRRLLVSNGLGQLLTLGPDGTSLAPGVAPITIILGHPCNAEIAPDGRRVTWVIDTYNDEGSWLCTGPFEPDTNPRGTAGKKLPLGWPDKSVNYFPDYSPDGRFLVYVHSDWQPGTKSYDVVRQQDVYVTRFPNCETTVRVTFTNAGCQHPHWWRPPQPTTAPATRSRPEP